ncbi:NYN domain-containing protein [Candidatus Parcubacteria bacterium]|jgi:uncharacterized LabA/DUF88 family protein|nr:NYN domain-containing protein [Candidatus Parcubacteria bacterium]MBT7228407.1 NYN domain-containing protein [Candidatus Parcubacteria bacterium]
MNKQPDNSGVTYVYIDGENIFFSVRNHYGCNINFYQLINWLEARFGNVKIYFFAHFSNDPPGLLYETKQFLLTQINTHVIDTRVREQAGKEEADISMKHAIEQGIIGPFKNQPECSKCVIMTGDGTFVQTAQRVQADLNIPVLVIGEEGTIKNWYRDAGITVEHLSPTSNDLLIVTNLDADIIRMVTQGSPIEYDQLVSILVDKYSSDPTAQNDPRIRAFRQKMVEKRIEMLVGSGTLRKDSSAPTTTVSIPS